MIFEIEFFCTDSKPLLEEEKELLEYLKPLHENNEIIVAPKASYYRKIGILNTRQNSCRTFFKARNSIKIPTFVEHRLSIPDTNYVLVREDHVRRHFSIDAYGVVNRLKLGFDFTLNPKVKCKSGERNLKKEEKDIYEVLKFLLEKIEVKPKDEANNLSLWELGIWLAGIINASTIGSCSQSNNNKNSNNKADSPIYTNFVGASAVIIYNEKDLPVLPSDTRSFKIDKKRPKVEISYYDFRIKQMNDVIKFYFIKINDRNCSKEYYHQLKNQLLSLRVNLLCLKNIIKKINLSTGRQELFLNYLLEEAKDIKNDSRYGFLNLMDKDKGEVLRYSERKDILKRINMLKKITVE